MGTSKRYQRENVIIISYCEAVLLVLVAPVLLALLARSTAAAHAYSHSDHHPLVVESFAKNHIIPSKSLQTNSTTDLIANHTNPVMELPPSAACECYEGGDGEASEANEVDCQCEGLLITRIPQQLSEKLQRLTIGSAAIQKLRRMGLKKYQHIEDIMMNDLPSFEEIESGAFDNLAFLRTIYISNAPNLQSVSAEVFRGISTSLRFLRILNCGLIHVPDINFNAVLVMVDLDGNRISHIESNSIKMKTEELILDNNELAHIDANAFTGSEIAKLSLKGNTKLQIMHDQAFAGLNNIQELDLSSTSLIRVPTEGLHTLERLRIQNTQSLKIIPSVLNFKSLQEAHLTHSFHCCAFKYPARHDPKYYAERQRYLAELQKKCSYEKKKEEPQEEANDNVWGEPVEIIIKRSFHEDITLDNYFADKSSTQKDINEGSNKNRTATVSVDVICGALVQQKPAVQCYPMPDALNPCEDVMGSNWLRVPVWVVVSLAVIGNVSVLVVLSSNRTEVTVFRFLMSNLAFADLCMGLYLMLLACIDIHSIGEYFNFAFDWQFGAGCKAAGFLTNFASHLSVFSLTIITLERWFAITYAIYLEKRLRLRTAVKIMIGGWLYSILMASLPLFGMSNYSSTSICLPMEARDFLDISYLVSLIFTNSVAFVVIVVCYGRIYYSLGKTTREAEIVIAKKMALLVFTNFVCWAPIAFFVSTALAGYPLIDVAKSKILLVFFYPLNSCANPYLYVIMTESYRRDLFQLLSRFGLCRERAQKYKLSLSGTTNIPLIDRRMTYAEGCKNGHVARKESGESFI